MATPRWRRKLGAAAVVQYMVACGPRPTTVPPPQPEPLAAPVQTRASEDPESSVAAGHVATTPEVEAPPDPAELSPLSKITDAGARDPAAGLPLPVVGELALIIGSAPLHIARSLESPAVQLSDAPRRADPSWRGKTEMFAARVIGIEGGWVEVETLDRTTVERQCDAVDWPMGHYALRLFIRIADLLPVVRTPIQVDDGGARWQVGTGEPLAFGEQGLSFRRRPFGIGKHPVVFTDSHVGRSYAKPRRRGTQGNKRKGARVGQLGLDYVWDDPKQFEKVTVTSRGKGWRTIELRTGCTTLTVRAPASAVFEFGVGRGSGSGSGRPIFFRVAKGAEVLWDNGEHAGVTLEEFAYRSAESFSNAELGCFDVNFSAWNAPTDVAKLRLCHRKTALTPAKPGT